MSLNPEKSAVFMDAVDVISAVQSTAFTVFVDAAMNIGESVSLRPGSSPELPGGLPLRSEPSLQR